jgi:hypothetical protein
LSLIIIIKIIDFFEGSIFSIFFSCTLRLGPHYRLFIGRQFSWFLISMNTYVSAHTKPIVVGRQIDRKIVGIPIQQESWPTIDRAWCIIGVRTFTDYPVGDPHIFGVQWLSAVQKF